MKPVNVKLSTYIDFNIAGDHVKISKYKNIFAEGYTLNWSRKLLVMKKHTVPQINVVKCLNREETVGTFYAKGKSEFRVEKVIKKKGDKLNGKWKAYSNLFSSWIDIKNIVL